MNSHFRLIQITDTHIVKDTNTLLYGVNTWHTLNQVVRHIIKHYGRPDILLHTGDITHDGEPMAYALVKKAIMDVSDLCYAINGNHDHRDTFQQAVKQGLFPKDKLFFQGKWAFILLDSVLDNEIPGELSQSELLFLEQTLHATREKNVVICLHHHPISTHGQTDKYILQNNADFLKILRPFKHIKLVLFGHIHQDFCATLDGVTFLGAPSTCMQVTPHSTKFIADTLAPGYRVIDFTPYGFTTTLRRIPS